MTRLCIILCVFLTIVMLSRERGNEEIKSLSEKLVSSRSVPDAGAKRRKMRRQKEKKRKGTMKRATQSVRRANSKSVSDSCFERVVTIMKMWKDVISNFEKQKKRMKKQNGTGSNKSGKKGAFTGVYQKLVSGGGGDRNNLTCAGSSDGEGERYPGSQASFPCMEFTYPYAIKTKLKARNVL